MYELPGSLRLTSTFPFVGRASELETLRATGAISESEYSSKRQQILADL